MGTILTESLGLWYYKAERRKEHLCCEKYGLVDRYIDSSNGKCILWLKMTTAWIDVNTFFFKYFAYYIFKEYDVNVFYDDVCFISC